MNTPDILIQMIASFSTSALRARLAGTVAAMEAFLIQTLSPVKDRKRLTVPVATGTTRPSLSLSTGRNRHSELALPLFLQSDLGLRWERTPVEDLHRRRARGKALSHRQLKRSLSLRPSRLWLDLANNLQSEPIQNSRRPVAPSSFDRPQRPSQSFEASAGSGRGRVRQRQRGAVPQRTSVRQEESFEEEATFARPPPPRRRPDSFQVQAPEESGSSGSGFQSFGSRQRQRGSQLASQQISRGGSQVSRGNQQTSRGSQSGVDGLRGSLGTRADLLSQVEAEIARREQQDRVPLSRGAQFPRGRRRQEEGEEEPQFGGRTGSRQGGRRRRVEKEETFLTREEEEEERYR